MQLYMAEVGYVVEEGGSQEPLMLSTQLCDARAQ